ncbi:MAG: 7TM diverse intracellular signaling domain-containing protein [Pedobacter sp.]|uniref:7TM diverse intracellular signaling domain-containing protein n=1 Tax=Pedobacter sp. TaxID=1411316 RepID=UPI00280981EF|nr:7TM diverse intracellular signaling domain-containing protein [Pedobacter sp.]MDQ8005314.1 7TM diverse intracellular signaling domain-containing protein [Pedobacter sp.]
MRKTLFLLFALCNAVNVAAQKTVVFTAKSYEHIFKSKEVVTFEDPTDKLTFDVISSPAYHDKFVNNIDYYPKNYNRSSAYWYRIKVKFEEDLEKASVIEFFDQITDHIEAYFPKSDGTYSQSKSGADLEFKQRMYQHKNFEFLIQNLEKGEYYYYFKVKSKDRVNVIIVFRTIERFIQYGLTEYLTYGLFYGMIFIFSFHNLLMYLAVRRRQYLYYILYIISVGLYEVSVDGIAYQYLWPKQPVWNEYAYGIALFCISSFALIFTKELLHVKQKAPVFFKIINAVLILRLVFFLVCLFYNPDWFKYKFVEFIPLSIGFITGIYIFWKKRYRPARFFVVGYTFLFLGFIIKIIHILGYARHIPGALGYYSLSFGFLLEMIFLSFAIGDQVRILKRKKENAQKQIIKQMQLNAEMKDNLNRQLEAKVEERTQEVKKQAVALQKQNDTIEKQNDELLSKNNLLQEQAEEISRMNVLLEKDNINLKTNIEKVTEARVNATELDFDEFSLKYPDKESCYKFLAELKWESGYACVKCDHPNYCNGKAPYNRRCTKCAYEESVLHQTIFENNRIPINKAFYLVYLMYNSKGAISSHKLSEKLGIRQSTCWTYASKVKKVMEERKKDLKGTGKSGWSKLVLDKKA